ncbi:MAG TPA: acyltransferase [Ramlibacter sp.]|nr:acyltransferase [Ramlibacter sp.]
MSGARATHWADMGESTFAAGLWLLYGVHRLFGRLPLRLLLYPVVTYYWLTQPVARRASQDYLQRMQAAHGVIGERPGWRHSLRHFLSFAETIADKTLAFSGRYRFDHVRYAGRDLMDALIARGQGALLVTAHMGCLELCQAAADRQDGLKLTVLVHTRHAERFNRVLRRLNPQSTVNLLQVTEVDAATAVMLAQRVAAGEFVAIAGDRVPVTRSKTTTARFLGQDAAFPVGAYVLASLIKCPLLLLGCIREGRGHLVSFELLAERVALARGRRDEGIAALAAVYAQRLEALLVKAPYDWFNFFPFWAAPSTALAPTLSPEATP